MPADISLRPFPYPFRAGLALCNDADNLTHGSFRRLYRFLTTDEDTEWGRGLGLHVGGSFFMYRSPDSPNELTVFDRLSSTITDDGEFLLACVGTGLIDVLHTYGCFTDARHFTRELAERAIATLDSRGLTVRTWVNHGPPTNVQCLASPATCQGDVPNSPAYHADLTVAHGVRWVWTGSEMTDHIELDPDARHLRTHARQLWGTLRRRPDRSGVLTEPYVLRDGTPVRRFFRFTGLTGRTPVLEDLPGQLTPGRLDELVASGGYAVVYQHLGVRRARPGFGPEAYVPVAPQWFTEAELGALRGLADRFHNGELWVAPTTHLLRYRDVHEGLHWHVRREPQQDLIVLKPGERSGVQSAADLADITFYCDRPEVTSVMLDSGEAAVVKPVRVNPPDWTSRQSITISPQPHYARWP